MAISVKSKVTIYKNVVKQLERAQIRALERTADYLREEIGNAQVIPRDKGTLQGEDFFVDYTNSNRGQVSLVHQSRYARRLYYHPEYNFHKEIWYDDKGKHDGNPNARGKWFSDWCDGGKKEDDVKKAFYKYFKQEAGI